MVAIFLFHTKIITGMSMFSRYNNPMKLLGLRTLIYPSDNLEADKAWWSDASIMRS